MSVSRQGGAVCVSEQAGRSSVCLPVLINIRTCLYSMVETPVLD